MVRSWAWTSRARCWRTHATAKIAEGLLAHSATKIILRQAPDQIALAVDHAGFTDPNCAPIYRGRGELIDHIFASHRLVNPDNVPAVEIVAATPLPSMTDDPSPQPPAPSDHAAVFARFNI